jgi:hypothetical protein
MRFEDDWNGLFIRGDDALMRYLPAIRWALEKIASIEKAPHDVYVVGDGSDIKLIFRYRTLQGLVELLEGVDQTVPQKDPPTLLKRFEDCTK